MPCLASPRTRSCIPSHRHGPLTRSSYRVSPTRIHSAVRLYRTIQPALFVSVPGDMLLLRSSLGDGDGDKCFSNNSPLLLELSRPGLASILPSASAVSTTRCTPANRLSTRVTPHDCRPPLTTLNASRAPFHAPSPGIYPMNHICPDTRAILPPQPQTTVYRYAYLLSALPCLFTVPTLRWGSPDIENKRPNAVPLTCSLGNESSICSASVLFPFVWSRLLPGHAGTPFSSLTLNPPCLQHLACSRPQNVNWRSSDRRMPAILSLHPGPPTCAGPSDLLAAFVGHDLH